MSSPEAKKVPLAEAAKKAKKDLTTEEMLEALKKERTERLAAVIHRYISDEV